MSGGNEKFERDFESFLSDDDSRLAALYRKLPHAEPDARLDAAVRAQAQRAVAAVAAPARTPASGRWLPALSVAAVVAVAAGIAFQLGPQLWQRPASRPEVESAAAPTTPPPATPQPVETTSSMRKAAAPAATAAPVAQAPATEMQEMENAASRPAPRAFPAPAQALRESTPPPPPAAAEAKPAMPAPATAPPIRAKQADTESAGAPAATLAAPATQDRNVTLYPEHWLANIRQMMRDGRHEEALRGLAEFRKRYPDYRLPDDLRDLR
jgi:Meckel syndrome type 1 protein